MIQGVTQLPAQRSHLALWVLGSAYFTIGTASLSVVGLGTSISRSLHVAPAQTGLLVTAFALTFAVCALLAQSLAGHLPRKTLLLGGLVLLVLGLLLGTVAQNFPALLLTRVFSAVGASVVGPVASAIGSLLVPQDERLRALATVFAGFTLASVMGVPLASALGPVVGWRGTLLSIAGLALIATVFLWVLVPKVEAGQRVTLAAYWQAFAIRGVKPALLTTLLQMGSPFLLFAVIGVYLSSRFHSPAGWISASLLAFGAAGVIGNALIGTISRRLNSDQILRLSLGGSALSVALLLIAPTQPWLGLLLFAVWSFFIGLFTAPQQARLIALTEANRSLMLALNASIPGGLTKRMRERCQGHSWDYETETLGRWGRRHTLPAPLRLAPHSTMA
jgi:DHA1 family inner membrane transport protein